MSIFMRNIPSPAVRDNSLVITSGYNKRGMARLRIAVSEADPMWIQSHISKTCTPVVFEGSLNWGWRGMRYVDGEEGMRFHLPFWDHLNDRLDAIRDRGMGMYVMIYTDDALKPDNLNIAPGPKAEERLRRYIVARMAPYPIVLWDTGIDIRE